MADKPSLIEHPLLEAVLAATDAVRTASVDIATIASDPRLRTALIDLLANEQQRVHRRSAIEHIEAAAEALDERVDKTEAFIELLDRSGLPIATAAVLSGIGLLVSMGTAVGPIVISVAGIVGLVVSGTTRTTLRLRASRRKSLAKKLRRLRDHLGALE